MPVVPTAKLTKRQKKGVAFRERKRSKSGDKGKAPSITENLDNEIDVHSLEDQVLVVATQGQQGHQASAEAFLGKGKAGGEGEAETRVVVAAKKRKKAGEEAKGTLEPGEPKPKRRKGPSGNSVDDMEQLVEDHDGDEGTGRESKSLTKQRFILFLGNLKYTTSLEAIQAHFSACVPPPSVRLLTPKPSTKSSTKTVTKSKGCAFLEFKHHGVLQQALKLHHSVLDGRQINVELTAGGGGKGSTRVKKLEERNKELEGQRRKRQDPGVNTQSSGTQRFSATSGTEQTHVRKRTWTVGDVEEKETHRGGRKHQKGPKKRRSMAKEYRTGVNAIPVG